MQETKRTNLQNFIEKGAEVYSQIIRDELCVKPRDVDYNISLWATNKQWIATLLSSDPDWSEDNLAIIKRVSEGLSVDFDSSDKIKGVLMNIRRDLDCGMCTCSDVLELASKVFKNCKAMPWCVSDTYDKSIINEYLYRVIGAIIAEAIRCCVFNVADNGITSWKFSYNLRYGIEELSKKECLDTLKLFAAEFVDVCFEYGKANYLGLEDVLYAFTNAYGKAFDRCYNSLSEKAKSVIDYMIDNYGKTSYYYEDLIKSLIIKASGLESGFGYRQCLKVLFRHVTHFYGKIHTPGKEWASRGDDSTYYTDYADYEQTKAYLFDLAREREIIRYYIISIHIGDYLYQSNGKGWHSCHRLDGGEWNAGTLSTMVDSSSIITYTLTEEDYIDVVNNKRALYAIPKVERCTYYVSSTGVVLHNHSYPSKENDSNFCKSIRQLLESKISEMLGVDNNWTLKRNVGDGSGDKNIYYQGVSISHQHFYGYEDWDRQGTSMLAILKTDTPKELNIGWRCKSIKGDWLKSTTLSGVCCEECGDTYEEDDLYYIDGVGYVCENCLDAVANYCDYHEQYESYCNNTFERVDDNLYCGDAISSLELNGEIGYDEYHCVYTSNYYRICDTIYWSIDSEDDLIQNLSDDDVIGFDDFNGCLTDNYEFVNNEKYWTIDSRDVLIDTLKSNGLLSEDYED